MNLLLSQLKYHIFLAEAVFFRSELQMTISVNCNADHGRFTCHLPPDQKFWQRFIATDLK